MTSLIMGFMSNHRQDKFGELNFYEQIWWVGFNWTGKSFFDIRFLLEGYLQQKKSFFFASATDFLESDILLRFYVNLPLCLCLKDFYEKKK